MLRKMKAFGIIKKAKIGNIPNEAKEIELAIPKFDENQVLVKIVASTLHIDDIALAQGTALGRFLGPKEVSFDKPYIMGSSFSGIVVGIGNNVENFKVGDEVIGIPNKMGEHGSWAEYRSIDKKSIRLKPIELSHYQSAAMVLAGCVAYGMTTFADVKKDDRCLVIGASGGIGSMVVQILKAKGANVIAICSTRNIEMVTSLGANSIIDYTKEDFSVKLKSKNSTMDFVFDSVGGKGLEKKAFQILNKKGKFLTVCGPVKYIGSDKLSWPTIMSMFWYIFQRSIYSSIIGPKYKFSDKVPSVVIDEMLNFIIKNEIKIPVYKTISFKYEELVDSLKILALHKARGRIVIDFTK